MTTPQAEDLPVTIYTDGACKGNPGPGGWACVMRNGARYLELSGPDASTTSNRMELMAAIRGLEWLTAPSVVSIFTDSMCLKDGITKWLPGWEAKGWRLANGGAVKNVDLWQRLKTATEGHLIDWRWVKGHAGDVNNEKADRLATLAALSTVA